MPIRPRIIPVYYDYTYLYGHIMPIMPIMHLIILVIMIILIIIMVILC